MLWAVLFAYGKKNLLQVRGFRAVPEGGGGTQRRDGSWTRVDAGVGDVWEDVRELSTPSPNFSLLVIAKQRHDEEAVIDRGRRSNAVSICYEKEELEGESLLRSWWRSH